MSEVGERGEKVDHGAIRVGLCFFVFVFGGCTDEGKRYFSMNNLFDKMLVHAWDSLNIRELMENRIILSFTFP